MSAAKKYFLDTNIFLRILAKDDPAKLHDCESLINQVSNQNIKAVTSSLVIAEVVWTCLRGYKLSREEVKEILDGILSIKNLKFEDKINIFFAKDLYFSHNIKFADCLIASHPHIASGKLPIVSYDREFDRLGIRRIEPSQLLKDNLGDFIIADRKSH